MKIFCVLLLFLLIGCRFDKDFALFDVLDNSTKQSPCGGFKISQDNPETNECRDEKFLWEYDIETDHFTFIHKNISTDCEKQISVLVYKLNDSSYMVEELRTGEATDCLCFYDVWGEFKVNSPSRIISLAIKADDAVVWGGTVDLYLKKGVIIIKKNVGYCE